MALSLTEVRQFAQMAFTGDFRAISKALRALADGDLLGTAGTAVAGRALVTDTANGISGFRDTRATPIFNQGAAGALNATGTLTAALMMGGIVTSTTAAITTATLDTAANLETALLAVYPGLAVSDYFEFSVINTGPSAFTIATAAGWTDGGGGFTAVATATSARFGVRRTAANAYTIFKIA